MSFSELEREYRRDLVGDGIYERIRQLAERLLKRRDPLIYARGAHDYRDAIDDIVNDFAVDVLLGERQIDYVMTVASSLSDFDRLIQRQLRRYLGRTRVRTVVDNLIDRAVVVLRREPFVIVDGHGITERYGLTRRSYDLPAVVSEDDLRRAATLAQPIHRSAAEGNERAPRIYDSVALEAVIRILIENVSAPIGRPELDQFLHLVLTPWVPSLLEGLEEDQLVERGLDPGEAAIVSETASRLVAAMSEEEKTIFQFKHANIADRELATHLGVSRQSLSPRKSALFKRLERDLEDLGPPLQAEVIHQICIKVAIEGRELP